MRIIANIGVMASILFLPWWITATILTVCCFAIARFYEAIFFGLLIDAMYGTQFGLYGLAYVFSIFSIIVFLSAALIRARVVW